MYILFTDFLGSPFVKAHGYSIAFVLMVELVQQTLNGATTYLRRALIIRVKTLVQLGCITEDFFEEVTNQRF